MHFVQCSIALLMNNTIIANIVLPDQRYWLDKCHYRYRNTTTDYYMHIKNGWPRRLPNNWHLLSRGKYQIRDNAFSNPSMQRGLVFRAIYVHRCAEYDPFLTTEHIWYNQSLDNKHALSRATQKLVHLPDAPGTLNCYLRT